MLHHLRKRSFVPSQVEHLCPPLRATSLWSAVARQRFTASTSETGENVKIVIGGYWADATCLIVSLDPYTS